MNLRFNIDPSVFYDQSGNLYPEPKETLEELEAKFNDACEKLTVDPENPKYHSPEGSNVIVETATNTLLRGCAGCVIPSSVTAIGGEAFHRCLGLKSVAIPEGVTRIEKMAFKECVELKFVTMADSVLTIDDNAFAGCSALTGVRFSDSLQRIDDNAFKSRTALAKVELPASLKYLSGFFRMLHPLCERLPMFVKFDWIIKVFC